MSWFADLAGKAENLLNNLDEQTGAVLRNTNGIKQKKHDLLHPEPTWSQKKKPLVRNPRRSAPISDTRSTVTPTNRSPPSKSAQVKPFMKSQDVSSPERLQKKTPPRKPNYSLNNSPKTFADDLKDDIYFTYGVRKRRLSLPSDLEAINTEQMAYNMQNLEVENVMLKNELNVVNREVSELLDRLRKTEDELRTSTIKLENVDKLNHQLIEEKELLSSEVRNITLSASNQSNAELKYKEHIQDLKTQMTLLNDRNKELDDKIHKLTEDLEQKVTTQLKLENELRHTHTTITELQSNLDKSNSECLRLEKDWEAYKLRVKSMLNAKDNEIKSIREGSNLDEDTKVLMEQLQSLKEEKEELSVAINDVRNESNDLKQHMAELELKYSAAERLVAALRDTLKEERLARNRAEAQCGSFSKEIQNIQMENGQTIASLRKALQDKENELIHLRETASSVRTSDTSALNVADYDVIRDIDSEKIHYLTQTLIQKQGKIDSLLADNNILRIQLDKLESKYRSEVASLRAKYSHSVVHLQDGGNRLRHQSPSPLYALSLRLGLMMKRFPIFRVLILIYMIGLHLWVLTVLLTSTPEDYVPRSSKS
ncbi:unnamed protein product [Danaus chrysippus]|uniref:(African queen) hypothetical protein n=1 Tax=Danaus chrysippus TaxID=151541 RepID=A0A8J2QRZ7_9NEOP|nr:unnamed protein product [Danaus chrysippus]